MCLCVSVSVCVCVFVSVFLSICHSVCPSFSLHVRFCICLHARMSVYQCLPGPVICSRFKNVCVCVLLLFVLFFFVSLVSLFSVLCLYICQSVCLSVNFSVCLSVSHSTCSFFDLFACTNVCSHVSAGTGNLSATH